MTCKYQSRIKTEFKTLINNPYKKFSGYYNDYVYTFTRKEELLGKLQKSLEKLKNSCAEVLENGGLGAYSFISGKVICHDKDYGLGISCKKDFEDDKEFFSYQSFSFNPITQDDRLAIHPTYEEALVRFESLIED